MSSSIAQTYSLFPTTPSSPNAFSMFSSAQSPRETHMMYEDLRQALRPTSASNNNNQQRQRTSSGSSLKSGLKKIFGGM
ncbi:hypothetical protein EIP91_010600 [Steccherinum ochraceum]|uniref:Uncharacterized protein n=1 Tax=Steccherinum ochraceum TaxID=92696 RepID=A0A4R0R2L9_9APHY|nr:hypothetical protein EIP91_010600 [Steccherinum ochraceum]